MTTFLMLTRRMTTMAALKSITKVATMRATVSFSSIAMKTTTAMIATVQRRERGGRQR